MTGQSDIPQLDEPRILLDSWEEGIIEAVGWVEVTEIVPSPEAAITRLESEFPLEDRCEEEHYIADGERAWMARDSPDAESWHYTDPKHPESVEFWVVRVVCAT